MHGVSTLSRASTLGESRSSGPRLTSTVRRGAATAGWAAVGFAVVLAAWQLFAWRTPDLPTPIETLRELRSLLAHPFHDGGPNDKGIGVQLLSSLQRVFTGFGLAAAAGVPFGLLVGASPRAWKAANPVVQFLRPVSPLVWFPIWLMVFHDSPKAAVWVIFMTALWPIVVNTAAGAASVPADQRNVARVFHLKRSAYVRHILLPHTLPSVVTGLRLSMGTAWMVIVAVEMLSGQVGIGFFVWDAYNALNLAKVTAAVVLIGAIGVALDLAFLRLARAVAVPETKP
jgi:nitrate/nitrite transport system permease protein